MGGILISAADSKPKADRFNKVQCDTRYNKRAVLRCSVKVLHGILFDGVVLSITALVSILTRCVIPFYTFLLLAYLNKMFSQVADTDDSEELTSLMEMLPHGDRNQTDVNSMSASSRRKHVTALEKQLMKLQILLDSAYKDIAVLRRENDTYRLINSQANRLIMDFKHRNSHVFRGTTPDYLKPNESGVVSSATASSSKVETSGVETPSDTKTKEEMDQGEKFIIDKPSCTDELAIAAEFKLEESLNTTESAQPIVNKDSGECKTDVVMTIAAESKSLESLKTIEAAVPILNEDSEESRTGATMTVAAEFESVESLMTKGAAVPVVIENIVETKTDALKTVTSGAVQAVTSLPGRPLTESPSDTDIFRHRASYSKSRTTPSQDAENDSGVDVSESSEDEEEELCSSVYTTSDEEGRSRRRSSSSSSEENVTDVAAEPKIKQNKIDLDGSNAHSEVNQLPSLTDLLKKASMDQGFITRSDAFKKFIRESALAFPKKPPVDSLTKLNVFTVWNRQP